MSEQVAGGLDAGRVQAAGGLVEGQEVQLRLEWPGVAVHSTQEEALGPAGQHEADEEAGVQVAWEGAARSGGG